ncbi:hypothetical protein [Pedobacter sp. N23S346]|uniref:hypothetical protein n=1 Tax=Pedobacter sp. N23S346 TaxID=3402750 RepID=UPI003ACDEF1D
MFELYKRQVISAFEKMEEDRLLSPALKRPSPANLKNECLDIFKDRCTEKDFETFRAIFGLRNSKEEYYQRIKISSADKFKPLDNYLKGKNEGTHDRNIELLAWFIDFQPRPYQMDDAYHISTPIDKIEETLIENNPPPNVEIPAVEEKIDASNKEVEKRPEIRTIQTIVEDPKPIKENNTFGFPKKYNKAVASFAVVVGVLTASYILFKENKQCMYWNGKQYISIACDERLANTSVIAFNEETADNLKKILRPDTLTENSVRKVWYNKVWTDSIDFYTAPGGVPTDRTKRLMPMTDYILNKYVIQKKLAKQL